MALPIARVKQSPAASSNAWNANGSGAPRSPVAKVNTVSPSNMVCIGRMARALRPMHTMFDGDTVFTLATGDRGAPDPLAFHALLDAAGDCFTRAIGRAMLAAESVETPAGRWRSYRDAFPSAFPTVPSPVSPLALAPHHPGASPTSSATDVG